VQEGRWNKKIYSLDIKYMYTNLIREQITEDLAILVGDQEIIRDWKKRIDYNKPQTYLRQTFLRKLG
jgi:hypothetical protein